MTEAPNPGFKFGQKLNATPEGREWLKGLESGFESIDTSKAESVLQTNELIGRSLLLTAPL
jgi:hypothetical protein